MSDQRASTPNTIEQLLAETEALRAELACLRAQQDASTRDHQQSDFFAEVLMDAPIAFGSCTPDGRVQFVNHAFLAMTGYSREELMAMPAGVYAITPERLHAHETEIVQRFFDTREPQTYEKAYTRKDGSEVPLEAWLNATYDDTGEIELFYLFATDITERKRALKLLTDHQAQLEAAVQQRTAELQTKIQTIEQQQVQLAALSVPVLKLWRDVLVLPIIGQVDETRASLIMEELLTRIAVERARWIIIDLTGVADLDRTTASQFGAIMRSVKLMGATCVISGIHPSVAQTMVDIGADFQHSLTFSNLEAALRHCMKRVDSAT